MHRPAPATPSDTAVGRPRPRENPRKGVWPRTLVGLASSVTSTPESDAPMLADRIEGRRRRCAAASRMALPPPRKIDEHLTPGRARRSGLDFHSRAESAGPKRSSSTVAWRTWLVEKFAIRAFRQGRTASAHRPPKAGWAISVGQRQNLRQFHESPCAMRQSQSKRRQTHASRCWSFRRMYANVHPAGNAGS